jgi:hypothetical protein
MLPELVDQSPAEVAIGSVIADGACDTRRYHDAVARRGARAAVLDRGTALGIRLMTTAGYVLPRNGEVRASRSLHDTARMTLQSTGPGSPLPALAN